MDALMAALVAALLIRVTDRSAGWVAASAERSGKPGAILATALFALIVTHAIAATAGYVVGQRIAPNPRQLMLGLALLAAAAGAIWPGKATPVMVRRPAVDTLAHLISTGVGGRGEFVVFAIALGGLPGLAGVGGVIGSLAVLGFAAVAGDAVWRSMPHRIMGWAIGVLLGGAGIWLALAALRLI